MRITSGEADVTKPVKDETRVIARPDTTFLVTNMMRSVMNEGTGAGARAAGFSLDAAALLAAHTNGGPEAYWRERLAQMLRVPGLTPTMSYPLAVVYCRLGELEAAIDHLDRMVENRVGRSVFIGIDASLRVLHGHPCFEALLRRVGSPQAQMSVTG